MGSKGNLGKSRDSSSENKAAGKEVISVQNGTSSQCTDNKWDMQPGFHAFGGLQVNRTKDDDCKVYCVSLPGCVAVDFNMDENTCWIFTDSSQANLTGPQDKINHYTLKRCASAPSIL